MVKNYFLVGSFLVLLVIAAAFLLFPRTLINDQSGKSDTTIEEQDIVRESNITSGELVSIAGNQAVVLNIESNIREYSADERTVFSCLDSKFTNSDGVEFDRSTAYINLYGLTIQPGSTIFPDEEIINSSELSDRVKPGSKIMLIDKNILGVDFIDVDQKIIIFDC